MSAQPFAFETEFAATGDVLSEGNRDFRKYSKTELEEAHSAGLNEGRSSSVAQSEAQLAAAASDLASRVGPLVPDLKAYVDQLRQESLQLALSLAKKMAGRALDQYPEENLRDVLTRSDVIFPKGPRILIMVPQGLAERMQAHTRHLVQSGHDIAFVEDPSAQPGDWRVEWDEGGMFHNREAVEQVLEAIINTAMQDASGQADLFSGAA